MSRSHRSVTAVLVAGVLSSLLPGSAAALSPLRFTWFVKDDCVTLDGPADTMIHVRDHARNGEFRGSAEVLLTSTGYGAACFLQVPLQGDTVLATWGASQSHSLVLPQMTVQVDRVANVVSGKSVPNSTVTVDDYQTHVPPLPLATKMPPTAADGSYSVDFTGLRNIKGGDEVQVSWTSAQGDKVIGNPVVPFQTAWVRNARFQAWIGVLQTSTFSVRSASGRLRSQVTRIGDEIGMVHQAVWTNRAGRPVATKIGDRVSATFASDATFTIPNVTIAVFTAANKVTGTCVPNGMYEVYVNYYDVSRRGNADPTGAFAEDFGAVPYDILPGAEVTVKCFLASGDQVARSILAP